MYEKFMDYIKSMKKMKLFITFGVERSSILIECFFIFWLVDCTFNNTVNSVEEGDTMDLQLHLSRYQERKALDVEYFVITSSSTAKLGKSLSIINIASIMNHDNCVKWCMFNNIA